jgi:hypothetical protein
MENILITSVGSAFTSVFSTAASGGNWPVDGSQQGFDVQIEVHREDHDHPLQATVLSYGPHTESLPEFVATGEASAYLVCALVFAVSLQRSTATFLSRASFLSSRKWAGSILKTEECTVPSSSWCWSGMKIEGPQETSEIHKRID